MYLLSVDLPLVAFSVLNIVIFVTHNCLNLFYLTVNGLLFQLLINTSLKFHSFQLRVRDLDSALEVEKSANTEANKAIDRLSKQIK